MHGMTRRLERLYTRYNRRECIHPDPLEFLYEYEDQGDREIAGFIASSLAYGRVTQILKSVSTVLDRMGPSPRVYIREAGRRDLSRDFSDFKHRFTTGGELADMLYCLKGTIRRHGSLRACFSALLDEKHETVLPALGGFVEELVSCGCGRTSSLIPAPQRGSACKRINLFLRWMVRRDAVDPGGWHEVSASKLIVPLDTHMHRIGVALGLTERKQADMQTALEITGGFREIAPEDPLRYDFALTRLGIQGEGGLDRFLESVSGIRFRVRMDRTTPAGKGGREGSSGRRPI